MTSFRLVRNRDAWATIRGYVYQVDVTLDRWLDLQPGQVLELERGEDIDVVSEAIQASDHETRQRLLEQVKHRASPLTLRSPETIAALVNFLEHRTANPDVSLHFRFVTNASSGHEKSSPLPNRCPAIEAWELLRQEQGDQETRSKLLHGIRSLLISFQKAKKPQNISDDAWKIFHQFVRNASDEELTAFICSFEWGMRSADVPSLRQSLQQRLQALQYARDADHAHAMYIQMFFTVFERLSHKGLKRLTVEEREQILAQPVFDVQAHPLLEILHDLLKTLDKRVGNVEQRMNNIEAVHIVHAEQIAALQHQLELRGQALDNETTMTYGEYNVSSVEIPPLYRKQEKEQTLHLSGRRLIEGLFPLQAVSTEARREKSIRHGHISTLHPWWARRTIVTARALVYGTLVSAPTDDEKRKESKDFMEQLCRWNVHKDILEQARLAIQDSNKGNSPRVLDMFTGGGSIPLEALRLGCETYAVDLNPVAYIIEICTLDYPQRYGSSLVADVKRWGTWVIQRAKKRLVGCYPPVTNGTTMTSGEQQSLSTHEMSAEGGEALLAPAAYLWTHVVLCPHCSATVPLVRQTWLRKKMDNSVALRVTPDHTRKSVHFEIVQGRTVGKLDFDPRTDKKLYHTTCLHCGMAITLEYVKKQGQNGNVGQQLMAVVCTQSTSSGKVYLTDENIPYGPDQNELLARANALCDEYELSLPGEPVPQHLTGGSRYGLTRFKDFFTPRQLLALLTFTIEVRHAYHAMLDEGMEPKRATAIATYLGVMIDHLANYNSRLCCWDPGGERSRQTYTRQALPMVWDFAEINPFTEGAGSPTNTLNWMTSLIQELVHSERFASIKRASALRLPFPDHFFDAIITDPPYYHCIPYADLSDFFYVWLKRSIGFLYPEELRTSLTPKEQESGMTDYRRDQSANDTKENYERMMAQAFVEAHRVLKPGAPLVCIHPDTSQPTLKQALERAGFDITYTWQLDTEKTDDSGTHRMGTTPSIILVARQRERK